MKRRASLALRPRPAVLAFLALLLVAAPAAAHAVLLESDPAPGTRLADPPQQVRVVLTETIDEGGSDLAVFDQQGDRVDLGDLEIEPGSRPVLTVSLPELPDGAYAARWQALSTVDGHFTFGTVGFAVGGFAPPESSETGVDAWDAPSAIARALAFLGTALAFVAVARILIGGPPGPATLCAGACLHLLGVATLAVDAARDASLDAAAFAATSVGSVLLLRLLLAAGAALLATVWWLRPVRLAPGIVALLLAAAAAQSARLGHASTGGPVIVALDALHHIASTGWIAGLFALFTILRHPAALGYDAAALGRLGIRFGTAATLLVVVTVGTGTILMAEILGPRMLGTGWFQSAWGLLLVTKWVLVAAMLGLALRNRRHARKCPASPGFPRNVAWEATLGALVLVAAGALTAVGAPQVVDAPENAVPVQGDEVFGTLSIEPDPIVGGSSKLTYFLQTEDGPIDGNDCGRTACLWLEVGPYGEGSRTALDPQGDGMWSTDVLWTEHGATDLTLEVQTGRIYLDLVASEVYVSKDS